MKTRHTLLISSLLAASTLLSGCAGFKANKLPAVTDATLQTGNTAKTKVFSSWRVEPAQSPSQYKKRFDDTLLSSNCCVLVDKAEDAELLIDGVFYEDNNPLMLLSGFITGATFFVVPSWHTINVHLSAEAKRGEQRFNYDMADSITMVMWLPMFLAQPFANPIDGEREVTDNTYKALVLKMKQDGLLQ